MNKKSDKLQKRKEKLADSLEKINIQRNKIIEEISKVDKEIGLCRVSEIENILKTKGIEFDQFITEIDNFISESKIH